MHQDACVDITTFTAVDGKPAWKCGRCMNARPDSVPKTLVPCPACARTQLVAACQLCASVGSVFVPTAEIRHVSLKAVPGMLMEG
jgi:hypothetical protein